MNRCESCGHASHPDEPCLQAMWTAANGTPTTACNCREDRTVAECGHPVDACMCEQCECRACRS